MDVLGWLLWLVVQSLSLAWSLIWFLISGWVATLAQIGIVVGAVFVMKYGWRRAPYEMAARMRTFGRFTWNWARAREGAEPVAPRIETREVVRVVRTKELGDVNLSTLLNVAMLAGLAALAWTGP